ncbi:SAV_915 family protein [Streptomyces sp. NPDC057743]|uniref:SAV_915 family protein n=1 Tax=Streptomyces sp. NPDC057743 TaxID=3346236 RepID=UPI0036AA912C
MSHHHPAEDPEPADRVPAGPLFVPVRSGPAGCTARLFRTPLGGRTAVGFTSLQRLTEVLGGGQPWVRLSEPALRALAEPVGATTVTVDPRFAPDLARDGRAFPDARDPRPVRDVARDPRLTTDVLRAPRLTPAPRIPRSSRLRAV